LFYFTGIASGALDSIVNGDQPIVLETVWTQQRSPRYAVAGVLNKRFPATAMGLSELVKTLIFLSF
jgi:hypothetical protein